jgi:ABC-2 type transport system permease protein
MFASILTKTLYDMRKAIFWWTLSFVLLTLWMVVLYPSFRNFYPVDVFENMPPSMKVLVGEFADMTTLEGFLSVELYNFFYPALLLASLLSFAGGLIGGEEESGTIDLLMAQPVPRWRMLLEKVLALAVFLLIILLAIFVGAWLGLMMTDLSMDLGRTALATIDMGMLAFLFGALTLCLTAFGLGRGASAGISGALAAITYLLNGLVPMTELPQTLRELSPWYYYGGGEVLIKGVEWGNLGLILLITLAFLGISALAFQRRDIAV